MALVAKKIETKTPKIGWEMALTVAEKFILAKNRPHLKV